MAEDALVEVDPILVNTGKPVDGLKKKSPIKKKTPPKLSIKQNLLLEKLSIFYKVKENMEELLSIVNNNNKISLRIIDWFVTNYSKKNNIIIPIKKRIQIAHDTRISPKTKKKLDGRLINLNVFLNYKSQLKAYSKKQFDPFCRRERITFPYKQMDDNQVDESNETKITTTVGQLNFFRWAIENNVLKYIGENLKDIENDMNTNIKKDKKGKTKKKKSLTGNINLCKEQPRRKRRELSMSATKTLNRQQGSIILNFD